MADARTCRRAGDRRAARVGKEVQNANGPSRASDFLHRKVPVGGLLREHARVLEVHGLYVERELLIPHLPLLGKMQV